MNSKQSISMELGELTFDWDPEKARKNLARHGVSFEQAAHAFQDPNLLQLEQQAIHGETRDHILGFSGNGLLLFVAHTLSTSHGQEIIRIISARRATRFERGVYASNAS